MGRPDCAAASSSRLGFHFRNLLALVFAGLVASGAQAQTTYVHLDSAEGDYIGQGERRHFTQAEGSFQVFPTGEQVRIWFSGSAAVGFESWNLSFAPASGGLLEETLYEDTRRFASATHARLDVSGDGRAATRAQGASACSSWNATARAWCASPPRASR